MGYQKGHTVSIETRRKIGLATSIALRGRKVPKETIEKRMRTRALKKAAGAYQTSLRYCIECGKQVSYYAKRCVHHSNQLKNRLPEVRAKLSASSKKVRPWMVGKFWPEERRRLVSEKLKGSNSYRWKGGVTPVNALIRRSLDYRLWRESVFKRDNYTCQSCGVRGGKIHADHIKPFAFFPELRFAIDNGRTLCVPCHKNTETYGHAVYGYMERLKQSGL